MHSCGAASPPWRMGELEAVSWEVFFLIYPCTWQTKGHFIQPHYIYILLSALWYCIGVFLALLFLCSALLYLPWHKSLDFSVLFWFFCGCWDPYVFIYNHRQGDFLVLSITVTQGLILFFMKISVRISFYIYGKRLTRSMIMSWKII